jgi:hypothetical protein
VCPADAGPCGHDGDNVLTLLVRQSAGYEAVQSLLDRALPDEERQDIITIVTAWPGIRGASRGLAPAGGYLPFPNESE